MSAIQRLGVDRCLMSKGKLSRFVTGGLRIQVLIASDWVIVQDPRNFVRGDYGQEQEQEPTIEPEQLPVPIVKKRGRPKGSKTKKRRP